MDPKDLIAEAEASERMAQLVSYQRDREWLTAKAQALRREAARIVERTWKPQDAGGGGRRGRPR